MEAALELPLFFVLIAIVLQYACVMRTAAQYSGSLTTTAQEMANTFITPEDLHDILIQDAYDAEYVEELEETTEHEIGGISLTAESYYDIYDEIYNGDEDKSLIRFVIAIVRLDWDAIDALKKKAIGHYTDEIDIPTTDEEEEYLEENEDEE